MSDTDVKMAEPSLLIHTQTPAWHGVRVWLMGAVAQGPTSRSPQSLLSTLPGGGKSHSQASLDI